MKNYLTRTGKRKLKIAVVVGVFPSVSETFIINQITYLLSSGYEVNILSYEKGKVEKEHQSILEYGLKEKCFYLKKPSRNLCKRYLQFFKMILLAEQINWKVLFRVLFSVKLPTEVLSLSMIFKAQWFWGNKYDLIHVHWATNASLIASLKSKKIIKTPFIVTFHGYDIQPDLLEKFRINYKVIFEHVCAITANTEYTKGLVEKITNNKIEVLPVGLDTSKFKCNSLKNIKEFRIIFCGRLIDFKGPDIAVEIVNDLVNIKGYSNIELVIIGDGYLKDKVLQLVQKYNLEDKVLMYGALTQEEIVQQMSISHIFLLPGIHAPDTGRAETQGLVIQEAQSMNLPVIVSDAGGMKYGVIDGITGYIVKQYDIKEFSSKVELLYLNQDLRKKMGMNGRKFVVKNFDNRVLGKKLLNIYELSMNQSN